MRTATIQQVPLQWSEILGWLAAGEEVEVMEQGRVVARVIPTPSLPSPPQPDFLSRAQAIWGTKPQGGALSELIAEARGKE